MCCHNLHYAAQPHCLVTRIQWWLKINIKCYTIRNLIQEDLTAVRIDGSSWKNRFNKYTRYLLVFSSCQVTMCILWKNVNISVFVFHSAKHLYYLHAILACLMMQMLDTIASSIMYAEAAGQRVRNAHQSLLVFNFFNFYFRFFFIWEKR